MPARLHRHHFSAGEKSRIGRGIDSPKYMMIPGCGNYVSIYLSPDEPLDMEFPQWIMDMWAEDTERPRAPTADPMALDLFKRMLAKTTYEGRKSYPKWVQFAMAATKPAGGDEGEYIYAFIDWCARRSLGKYVEHETGIEEIKLIGAHSRPIQLPATRRSRVAHGTRS